MSTIHPFEAAGLGKAPFKYRGIITRVCGADTTDQKTGIQTGYTGQPAGSCDFCGQGIKYCCQIEGADGSRFEVGTDCVEKLNRDDNADYIALARQVGADKATIEAAQRREAANRRKAKEAARIEAARATLEAIRPTLATQRHPHNGLADSGKTLADYYDWMFSNAGNAGRLRVAAAIEAEAAKQTAAK